MDRVGYGPKLTIQDDKNKYFAAFLFFAVEKILPMKNPITFEHLFFLEYEGSGDRRRGCTGAIAPYFKGFLKRQGGSGINCPVQPDAAYKVPGCPIVEIVILIPLFGKESIELIQGADFGIRQMIPGGAGVPVLMKADSYKSFFHILGAGPVRRPIGVLAGYSCPAFCFKKLYIAPTCSFIGVWLYDHGKGRDFSRLLFLKTFL